MNGEDDDDDDMKKTLQTFETNVDSIVAEKNDQSNTFDEAIPDLLSKFQEVQELEDDWKSSIRQSILFCHELINTVDNITNNDINDLKICLQLLCEEFLSFESLVCDIEKRFIKEIFFELLDLLNKPQICSYLNNTEDSILLQKEIYKCLTNLSLILAWTIVPLVPFEKDDITTDRYNDLFRAMSNQLKTKSKYDHQTRRFILLFLWDFSDRVVTIPWLLNVDFVETMLQCLKMIDFSSGFVDHFLGIIHNIARHDNGVDELRKFDGLHILKEFQSQFANKLDPNIDLLLSMAIALLSTSEQIRSDNKRMNKILNQLLQIVIEAAGASNFCARSFHISEPLAVLTKLFVDDYSLEYVLNHAETDPPLTTELIISLFSLLLVKFQGVIIDTKQLRQLTRIALTNILWSISFQDRYKIRLMKDKELLQVIKRLAMDDNDKVIHQYIPRLMESISKAANGILYNINEVTVGDRQLISDSSRKKPLIMISYAHGDKLFYNKILDELQKNRNVFDIWIDRDHLSSSENLWERTGRGIKEANIVLCLLSHNYYNSKAARQEATFAIKCRKTIIPLYLGEPGACDWLDIHIVGVKDVHFKDTNGELDRNKVQELLETIQATSSESQTNSQQQQTKPSHVSVHTKTEMETVKPINIEVNKPPEQWTKDDLRKWFENYQIPDTMIRLFNFQSFTEVYEYGEKLRSDPENEFTKCREKYSKIYAGNELEEYKFSRFKTAVFSLTDKYSKQAENSTSANSSLTSNSNVCTIS